MLLTEEANKIYLENFPPETNFERAVFFSWYCDIKDCKFCYMSTQKTTRTAVRSVESLLAEVVLIKKLKWDFGFLSGGLGAYKKEKFLDLVKKVSEVYGEKIWLNVGPLKEDELKSFKPYVKGVVGSIETINPKVHGFVCPSKPIEPYEEMFETAEKLKLKKAITIILGLGETKKDFSLLKEFIEKHNISKIHFYCLNPQKGTMFENKKSPTKEYHAWWIAKTRIDFPKIDIQAGIWLDKVDRVSVLLQAGANSISKYPAIKHFRSKQSVELLKQCEKSGRKFKGCLVELPKVDWDNEVDRLMLGEKLKEKINIKLNNYLVKMK